MAAERERRKQILDTQAKVNIAEGNKQRMILESEGSKLASRFSRLTFILVTNVISPSLKNCSHNLMTRLVKSKNSSWNQKVPVKQQRTRVRQSLSKWKSLLVPWRCPHQSLLMRIDEKLLTLYWNINDLNNLERLPMDMGTQPTSLEMRREQT